MLFTLAERPKVTNLSYTCDVCVKSKFKYSVINLYRFWLTVHMAKGNLIANWI